MTDNLTMMRWVFRAVLVGLAALILFARLLPIDLTPVSIPGPDILLAMVFAWVLRRPDYVPVLLVAALFFLYDMLLMRVPGLWPLVTIAGIEFLRSRQPGLREQPFMLEWALVAVTLLAMVLAQRAMLLIFLVDQAPLGRALLQCLSTILVYPLAVFVSVYLLGVAKIQPGDEAVGRKVA